MLYTRLKVTGGLYQAGADTTFCAAPQTPFGTKGLNPEILGALTLILAPVQLALIIFSMIGFSQGWNVETEVRDDEAERGGGGGRRPSPEPATA